MTASSLRSSAPQQIKNCILQRSSSSTELSDIQLASELAYAVPPQSHLSAALVSLDTLHGVLGWLHARQILKLALYARQVVGGDQEFWKFLAMCAITVNLKSIFRHLDATLPKYQIR